MANVDKKELHPSVVDFKQFMNKHPKLVKEIRKKGESWQEYYEKWVLLGEDDPFWSDYKEESDKAKEKTENKKQVELLNQLSKLMDYVDFNKVQKQVNQLSETINMVQDLLKNHTDNNNTNPNPNEKNRPFHFFRD